MINSFFDVSNASSWWFCIALMGAVLIAMGVLLGVILKKYKPNRILTPYRVIFVAVAVIAFIWFCPLYYGIFREYGSGWAFWKMLVMSLQSTIRIFAVDDNYLELMNWVVQEATEEVPQIMLVPEAVKAVYGMIGSVLYFVAPVLTFGFILSFFKNVIPSIQYWSHPFRDAHVFSELNEKSLALAKSINEDYKNEHKKAKENRQKAYSKKPIIVFTDVFEKHEEEHYDLAEGAREIGAILFRKDLESIRFKRITVPRKKIRFYLISEDEAEKHRHTTYICKEYDKFAPVFFLELRKKYFGFNEENEWKNRVKLYVFSEDVRSELRLATKKVDNIKVTRVNDIQALIYHNLDVHGLRLFRNALIPKKGQVPEEYGKNIRVISAVIVGLGKYGMEMLKALTWFCQMQGYFLKINAFDTDEKAEARVRALFPELMEKNCTEFGAGDPQKTGWEAPTDARYSIKIHSDTNVETDKFTKAIEGITDATYVFVCLGTDNVNISVAARIRSIYHSLKTRGIIKHNPDIETVVYDTDVSETMGVEWCESDTDPNVKQESFIWKKSFEGAKNFKNQPYGIHIIGDLESFYSCETVINSELEKEGARMHTGWTVSAPEEARRNRCALESIRKGLRNGTIGGDRNGEVIICAPEYSGFINATESDMVRISLENLKDHSVLITDGRSFENLLDAVCKMVLTKEETDSLEPEKESNETEQPEKNALSITDRKIRLLKSKCIATENNPENPKQICTNSYEFIVLFVDPLTKNLEIQVIYSWGKNILTEMKLLEKKHVSLWNLRLLKELGAKNLNCDEGEALLLSMAKGEDPRLQKESLRTLRKWAKHGKGGHSDKDVLEYMLNCLYKKHCKKNKYDKDASSREMARRIPWAKLKKSRVLLYYVYDPLTDSFKENELVFDRSAKIGKQDNASVRYEKMLQFVLKQIEKSKEANGVQTEENGEPFDVRHAYVWDLASRSGLLEPLQMCGKREVEWDGSAYHADVLVRLTVKEINPKTKAVEGEKDKIFGFLLGELDKIPDLSDADAKKRLNECLQSKKQEFLDLGAESCDSCAGCVVPHRICLVDATGENPQTVVKSVESGLDFMCGSARIDYQIVISNNKANVERDENGFWQYEYFYRSSLTKAIHKGLKQKLVNCEWFYQPSVDEKDGESAQEQGVRPELIHFIGGIKAFDEERDRTPEELLAIGTVEHCRWNAFMRTEGYSYHSKRDDLGKRHLNLVPTGNLSTADLRKDA